MLKVNMSIQNNKRENKLMGGFTNEEKIIKCFNGSSYGSWRWQRRRDTGEG